MTIIAAASWGGEASITCDSFGTDGWGTQSDHGTKLRHYEWGSLGFAGSYRLVQAVGDCLEGVTNIETAKGLRVVVDILDAALVEFGWNRSSEEGMPWNKHVCLLLVSNRGRIWTIESNLAFLRHKHYAAIGSGYVDARGAMYAHKATGGSAVEAARLGTKCASFHNSGCGGRMHKKEFQWR